MAKKLNVAFLWHMHQPLYKDFRTGRYQLPWIRLHATHSYYDMAAILKDFPEVRVTFNFTPSLLWQIQDVTANGGAYDLFLAITFKDAGDLTTEDKCFLLKNFFSCPPETAILPLERYRELFERRGDDLTREVIMEKSDLFSEQDYRDLQALFNLAWCGYTLREKDPLIKRLYEKASDYTEDDKRAILKRQREVVASIIPMYKKLQDEGKIEIATTPYYHPILPLLCKGDSEKGYDFCMDARAQVKKAVDFYKSIFGKKPVGMWPAEGSVSPEVIPVFADEGIKWIASDEGVLLKSFEGSGLSRDDLVFSPFSATHEEKSVKIVFRDLGISNDISFNYAGKSAKEAADDLIGNLTGIRHALKGSRENHIVSIILDGENPWPHYRDGGREFLSEVYSRLTESDDFEMVTIGDYLKKKRPSKKITDLYSGSWIHHNFNRWIGSPQKDLAWKYLRQAREALFSAGTPSAEGLEELYIAEGSDWFWWYDEFGTELNHVFDDLYRMHLVNIYRIAGTKVPQYLSDPIYTQAAEKRHDQRPLSGRPLMMDG